IFNSPDIGRNLEMK
ncbi:hypothetical protein JTB14_021865, partial [Gonioctena quinquepunctata]